MFKQAPLNVYVEKQRHSFIWRWIGLILLFFICTSAFAQNTKGDKPVSPLPRIAQKSRPQKTKRINSVTRDISGRRLRTRNKSSAARAIIASTSPYKGRVSRGGDRPGKRIRAVRTRIRSSSAQLARNNVYPNKGPYINNPSPRPRKNELYFPRSGGSIKNPRSLGSSKVNTFGRGKRIARVSASKPFISRGKKNVYWGKFSRGENAYTKDISGRPIRTKNFRTPEQETYLQTDPYNGRGNRGDQIKRRKNFPGFISASKRGERAWRGDISKKPIKKNSFKDKTEKPEKKLFPRKLSVTGKLTNRAFREKRKRSISGQYTSNRKLPAKAPSSGFNVGKYRGNLKSSILSPFSNQGLRFSGTMRRSGRRRGFATSSERAQNNKAIAVRIPAGGADVGTYQGRTKRWNFAPSLRRQGIGYSGSIKTRRPRKAGGSISGRSRNNNGNAIAVRIPTAGAARAGTYSGNLKSSRNYQDQGEEFSGFIKARKPLKGGGSISGKSRNNNGNAIAVSVPKSGAARAGTYSGNLKSSRNYQDQQDQGEEFTGFIKARKPLKGGGSVSGRSRNNNGNAIAVRIPTAGAARAGTYSGNLKSSRVFNYTDQGEEFTGFIKARKPLKGGGSVSGRSRNNNGNAIAVRIPTSGAAKAGTYSGNLKSSSVFNYTDQGEEFTGFIRARKPLKGGGSVSGKLWNNNGRPINGNPPLIIGAKAASYSGKIKRKQDYIQNEKAAKSSLKKREPEKYALAAEGLQIKVRRDKYEKNPNAKPGALKGVAPTPATVKASEYMGRMKMIWDFKHNPSSSQAALDAVRPTRAFAKGNDYQGRTRLTKNYRNSPNGSKDALKVIAPGKAYAKIGSYQGNLKMKKPHGSNLHPDAKFAHGRIDNVSQERTILTNAKLWWSRLFKKNDTQPNAVKEKIRRPRYDKNERELWKDLYD